MKIQTLYKRLSMPLLLTVISATGIGVSTPAHSTSLIGSQSKAIDANPEARLIAGRRCRPGDPCHDPRQHRAPASPDEQNPTVNPSREAIEKPVIDKPEIEKPVIDKPEIEKPGVENRTRHPHHRLPQQQQIREPLPQNNSQ